MIWDLPKQLQVCGTAYDIRTDYRDILRILCAFDDPDLDEQEKLLVCLMVLYEDFEDMPRDHYEEALKAAKDFIDHGADSGRSPARTMDWEQDANLIFPAVNAAAGEEIRGLPYLHWWTFLGYFMSIDRKSTYATVLGLRQKKARGKKLEKWERDFWNANKGICKLQKKLSQDEIAERERLNKIING